MFQVIHPADLRRVWARMRPELEKLEQSDWIPEDVYHYIKSGQVALFFHDKGAGCTFFVVRRLVAEFSGEVSCHVWIAVNGASADAYSAAVDLFRDAAKRMGASRITFSSPRHGWAKRFPSIETTYEIPA